MPEQDPIEQRWRTGSRVTQNVYRGDTPMFQCHTPEQAVEVVALLNAGQAATTTADPNDPIEQRIAEIERRTRSGMYGSSDVLWLIAQLREAQGRADRAVELEVALHVRDEGLVDAGDKLFELMAALRKAEQAEIKTLRRVHGRASRLRRVIW